MQPPSAKDQLGSPLRQPGRSRWATATAAALTGAILSLLLLLLTTKGVYPVGQGLVELSYDWPFAFRSDLAADGAVILYQDEQSSNKLGQDSRDAWDLKLHARLLRRLQAAGVRAVVFDVLFNNPKASPAAVAEFAGAIREAGMVVIGADWQSSQAAANVEGRKVAFPLDLLRDAAKQVALINSRTGADGAVREHLRPRAIGAEFLELPPMAWAAAALAQVPVTGDPARVDRERWANFYGPPMHLTHYPYFQALQSGGIPDAALKGKVVFVGAASMQVGRPRELKDEFPGPTSRWTGRIYSGVEIHATIFLNLLRGDWLTRLPLWAEILLLLLTAGASGFGLAALRPWWATLAAVAGFLALAVLACWMAMSLHVWFAWLLVGAVQLPVAWASSVVAHSLMLYGEKRVLEHTLSLHLSPARVKQIQRRPDLLSPGAEEQEVSILFTDITNFSRVTARMPSDDLFKLLNQYYESALECVHETDGTVINLVGDAIFAIWNAPFVQPDQQQRALQAALLMQTRLSRFRSEQFTLPLPTRIGLHTARAHVGNLGSSMRFQYTAVGNAVNLTSRLEGLNKFLGTTVLATRAFVRLVEPQVTARSVGSFRFKGLDEVVEVYELIGGPEIAAETQPWRDAFRHALVQFHDRAFDQAEATFRKVLEFRPADGPTAFYLESLTYFRLHAPPPDWMGEIDLKEK